MQSARCDKICRVRIVRKMNYEKVALARSNGKPIKKSRSMQHLAPPRVNVPTLHMARIRSILKAPTVPASVFGVGRSLSNRRVTFAGIVHCEQPSNDSEIDGSSEQHDESEVDQRNRDQPLINFSDESDETSKNDDTVDTSIEAIQSNGISIIDEFDPFGNNEPVASGSGASTTNLLSTLDWSAVQSPSMQNSAHSVNENASDLVTSTPISTNEQVIGQNWFPQRRWQIPKLIPIKTFGKKNILQTANANMYGQQSRKQGNESNAREGPSGENECVNSTTSSATTIAPPTFDISPNFGALHYDSKTDSD